MCYFCGWCCWSWVCRGSHYVRKVCWLDMLIKLVWYLGSSCSDICLSASLLCFYLWATNVTLISCTVTWWNCCNYDRCWYRLVIRFDVATRTVNAVCVWSQWLCSLIMIPLMCSIRSVKRPANLHYEMKNEDDNHFMVRFHCSSQHQIRSVNILTAFVIGVFKSKSKWFIWYCSTDAGLER